MRLLLFRHGIAVDPDAPGCPSDPERFLTDEGIEKTRAAARGLAQLEVRPALVLSSPYKRAAQTAEIVAAALGLRGVRIQTTEALLPGAPPQALFGELAGYEVAEILCTGHAPHLDRAIARALHAERGSVSALKKAGAALLELHEIDPPRGELIFLATAKMLRKLGKP